MKLHQGRALPLLLATGVLVGGVNIAAFAATGGNFILGFTNKADQPSTLVNTGSGPALKIKTRASSPPMTVSSSKKVTKLNADQLDGLDSTQLATNTTVFTDTDAATDRGLEYIWHFPVQPGSYQLTYSVGAIPTTSPNNLICGFLDGPGSTGWSVSPFGGVAFGAWVSGTAVVTYPTAQSANFFCDVNSGTFKLDGVTNLQITVTRINHVSTTPALRSAPRGTLPRVTAPRR